MNNPPLHCYRVGGAVRDTLLGLPVKDQDWVVVGSTVDAMIAQGFQPVGRDFPVFLHPITQEEYALARTERKTGVAHHHFTCHAHPSVTLTEDLKRRDLTINAIAQDADGQLIDPYGGCADLQARRLRHVSDAFQEDPLRIFRVARFLARFQSLGFRIAPETLTLMQHMAAQGDHQHLAGERIWAETASALAEHAPWAYFETLATCGVLTDIMPEIDQALKTSSAALDALHHATQANAAPHIRLACMLPVCQPTDRHHGMDALRPPKLYTDLLHLMQKNTPRLMQLSSQLDATHLLALFNTTDLWRRPQRLNDVLATWHHQNPTLPKAWFATLQRTAQAAASVALTPEQMHHLQGIEMGQYLRRARLHAIEAQLSTANPT